MDALQKQGELIRRLWNDEKLKAEFKADPKTVMEREFGVKFPAGFNLQILEETNDQHYFVIPANPSAIGAELDDAQLEQVSGGTVPIPWPTFSFCIP